MTISFNVPTTIEQALSRDGQDPSDVAKEAAMVELFRRHRITHHELAESLGLSRFETDGLLKRHEVSYDLTLDDVLADAETSRRARSQ